ncbi:MAG: translation initiation factor 2 [Hyphomonas sp.]|uniref:translation initiation factor 2 n=1 Tax=Hyphomonas sp. TaxID=87 RepID=UPI0030026847
MKRIYLLLPLAIAVSGCATVTRGTTEAFLVETEPSGANVSTSLGLSCTPTPCAIPKVKREAEFSVTIEKEGYKTTIHNITHQMSGGGGAGMAGNVILGGGIGAILDANNGSTQELVPNPLKVTLEKLPEASDATAEIASKLEELTDDQPGS